MDISEGSSYIDMAKLVRGLLRRSLSGAEPILEGFKVFGDGTEA
jgi:hypothetical protein